MTQQDYDEHKDELQAVSIPVHGFPLISRGSYKDMIKTYFSDKEVHNVILNPYDFVIVSPFYFSDYNNINYLATTVYRSFKPSESSFQDLVYGPSLLIGQYGGDNNTHTSVSQQTLEAVLNIFTRDLYTLKYVP
jgi:hypothetical protein